MTAPTWRCGHPREGNAIRSGAVTSCRSCREARLERQRTTTAERNAAICAGYLESEDVLVLARRHGVGTEHVKKVLRESGLLQKPATDPDFPERALRTAASLAGSNVDQLVSWWRAPKTLVHARWAFMVAMHKRGASAKSIARRLNRDHSTVLYGLRQAEFFAARSQDFAAMLEKVRAA